MHIFDYVMMLTAIVIGLAMTHLMQGVARIIEDPRRTRIWWVHLLWVAHMGTVSVFWWWFEYKLRLIATWTFQLYVFVLGYAFLLYLICTLLFPSHLPDGRDFKDYFLSRRRWFFGMLIALLAVDVLDTLAKGMSHFASLGIEYPVAQTVLAMLCVVGMISPRERVQGAVVLLVFGYLIVRVARFFEVAA